MSEITPRHLAFFCGGVAVAGIASYLLQPRTSPEKASCCSPVKAACGNPNCGPSCRCGPSCKCGSTCGCSGGAVAASPVPAAAAAPAAEMSTTSSAQGTDVYETSKAVAEYLLFHFGTPGDILPYDASLGHHGALDFAARTGALCRKWAQSEGLPLAAAFDVGCAVGGTSFELSKDFERVVGLDFSHAFVAAANSLKATGRAPYTFQREGSITGQGMAIVPAQARPQVCTFLQGDACSLPSLQALGGGAFTVIHAANLLCRLPDPMDFIRRLPSLLVPGGLVVHVSPFSWLPQYTPKDKWLGGKAAGGEDSLTGLKRAMEGQGFALLATEDCPFLIREHARKFQLGFSCVTVWKKL